MNSKVMCEIQPKMDPELAALIGDISASITNPDITVSDVVDIGKALYKKRYRKADKVRKETAEEILQALYSNCYMSKCRLADHIIGHFMPEQIIGLAKRYGVEVEK